MEIYTIGFSKKSAYEFFSLLKENEVKKLIDIRLNNTSQLAGFTKGKDLEYFLNEICNIKYVHDTNLSPTKEILDNYKKSKITWDDYEKQFSLLLNKRNIKEHLKQKYNANFDKSCFLCSELKPLNCHRRLIAEYIKNNFENVLIKHLWYLEKK